MIAIVTEDGKLYAINDNVKKGLTNQESVKVSGKNKSFSIFIKGKEWIPKNVFCGINQSVLWFTAEKGGEKDTF